MPHTYGLGPLKFCLQATIGHHGPSIHSGHYTASINCCKKKHSIATITQLRSLELLIKLLYCICFIIWIDWHMLFGLELEGGSLIAPMTLAHPPHPLTTGRGTSAEICGLDDVFPPDDLGSRPEALCLYIYIYIYIYMHSFYEFWILL